MKKSAHLLSFNLHIWYNKFENLYVYLLGDFNRFYLLDKCPGKTFCICNIIYFHLRLKSAYSNYREVAWFCTSYRRYKIYDCLRYKRNRSRLFTALFIRVPLDTFVLWSGDDRRILKKKYNDKMLLKSLFIFHSLKHLAIMI